MKYLILIACILIFGCYSEHKARTQFNKAAVAYPEIPAQYCSENFIADTLMVSDTITKEDTLYIEGQDRIDTTIVNDTVRITTIKTLPSKTITKTITVHDSIRLENKAAIELCNIERRKVVDALTVSQASDKKHERQAKVRGLILFGLLLALGVWTYFKVRNVFKPKV